ncbi:hypothetical protein Dimus_009709 [Dionaea muscipula]
MASSAEVINGGSDHQHMVVEMAINDADASVTTAADVALAHEISPLLTPSSSKTPKINIFSVSYPRRKPREQVSRYTEAEISVFSQIISWAWGGSRFSGLLCMALSSIIYCMMGALWETFTDCIYKMYHYLDIIILMVAKDWTTTFWTNACEEIVPWQSYHRLPLIVELYILAIVLSFSTPIMAATMAIFILHEKLKVAEIGGLVCSFFGVVFIFWPKLTAQEAVEDGNVANAWGSYHLYAIVFGLFSSVSGGVCYCLIRAGAKASDQPVVTVFIFGLLGTPAAAVCIFIFQDFVFPSLYSLLLMIILGLLAFLAEVLLARGLHLEKTSKVVNIQYIEAVLSHLWGISSSRLSPSLGGLGGCLLILLSVCCTMYFGPDKETE